MEKIINNKNLTNIVTLIILGINILDLINPFTDVSFFAFNNIFFLLCLVVLDLAYNYNPHKIINISILYIFYLRIVLLIYELNKNLIDKNDMFFILYLVLFIPVILGIFYFIIEVYKVLKEKLS